MDRPWWNEDNKVNFEAEGFKCKMMRGPVGAWCGYVGIPKAHPWYGKNYNDRIPTKTEMLGPRHELDHGPISLLCAAFSDVDINKEIAIDLALRVHGGITWSDDHAPMNEPDGLWWFGFDCAHAGDLCPSMEEHTRFPGNVYRNQSYVVSEVQSLAAQLKEYSNASN